MILKLCGIIHTLKCYRASSAGKARIAWKLLGIQRVSGHHATFNASIARNGDMILDKFLSNLSVKVEPLNSQTKCNTGMFWSCDGQAV